MPNDGRSKAPEASTTQAFAEADALAPATAATTSPPVERAAIPLADLPRPRRQTAWAVAAAVICLPAVLLLLWRYDSDRSTPPSYSQRTLRQFTFHGGLQREPAWSPDGQLVAYTSDVAGNSDIWIQSATDPRPVRLTSSPAEDSEPEWSPDGQAVAFRSERDGGGIYVIPRAGGSERRLTTFGYRPRWSPDGRLVLFSSSGHQGGASRLYLVPAVGGDPRQLRPDVLSAFSVIDAAWAPGGSRVSIWGRRAAGDATFVTVPVDRGDALTSALSPEVDQQIKSAQVSLGHFTWSRSGRHLFFEGTSERVRNIWRVTVDPRSLAWTSGPERLTTGAGQDTDITVSRDGSRMIFTTRVSRTRVWTFPFDPVRGTIKGDGQPLTSGGAGEQDVDAPVDGSKLVYSAVRGNRQELWERTLADGHERLLISTTEWRRTRPAGHRMACGWLTCAAGRIAQSNRTAPSPCCRPAAKSAC